MGYAGFIAFPTLMASLAFVHSSPPYQSSGTFCYLPGKPIWYRMVLSWVPRCLILMFIIAVYIRVYRFAKYKFEELFEK